MYFIVIFTFKILTNYVVNFEQPGRGLYTVCSESVNQIRMVFWRFWRTFYMYFIKSYVVDCKHLVSTKYETKPVKWVKVRVTTFYYMEKHWKVSQNNLQITLLICSTEF